MAKQGKEYLSPEIITRGIENSGPYAGSLNFSVRVRRCLPDFLSSVNLKYVKLGYGYLINHRIYLAAAMPILLAFGTQIAKLTWGDFYFKYDTWNALLLGFLSVFLYIYFNLTPRATYLLDFACYLPPNELKVHTLPLRSLFIELAHL